MSNYGLSIEELIRESKQRGIDNRVNKFGERHVKSKHFIKQNKKVMKKNGKSRSKRK